MSLQIDNAKLLFLSTGEGKLKRFVWFVCKGLHPFWGVKEVFNSVIPSTSSPTSRYYLLGPSGVLPKSQNHKSRKEFTSPDFVYHLPKLWPHQLKLCFSFSRLDFCHSLRSSEAHFQDTLFTIPSLFSFLRLILPPLFLVPNQCHQTGMSLWNWMMEQILWMLISVTRLKKQYVLQLRKWVTTKNKSLKRFCGVNVSLVHNYVFLNLIPVI